MQLSFPHSNPVELAFKVGIAGTQSTPTTVALVIEKEGRSLSYAAVKQGDDWVARVENPGAVFGAGEVKVGITVLLNSRLFTPFKTTAIIEELPNAEVNVAPAAPSAPPVDATPEPVEEPAVQAVPEPEPEKITITLPTREEMVKDIVSQVVGDMGGSLLKAVNKPSSKKPVKEAAAPKPKAKPKLFKLKKVKVVFR